MSSEEHSRGPGKKREGGLPGKPPFLGGWKQAAAMTGGADSAGEESSENQPKKNSVVVATLAGDVAIENYCPAERLEGLEVDGGIYMFSRHNPERQKKALVRVAGSEGGNVVAGTLGNTLVSYIGIHHPSERERWGKPRYKWLYELGAIEVSRGYRKCGLARNMMKVAWDDPFYDDKVVITTAFTWHWDLEGTGMTKMEYRELFVNLAARFGFLEMATDEPNVTMDSANLFLVRLGSNLSFSRYQRFASLLFTSEWESMLRGF